jgi:hypothetical protein
MPAAVVDKYSNIIFESVTESAANTWTAESVDIGLTIFEKVALLVHRIQWSGFTLQLAAVADMIQFGLSSSETISGDVAESAQVITWRQYKIADYGTAANNRIWEEPVVDDYSTLPGGGILIVPRPLYLWVKGANLANPGAAECKIFFTIVKLKPEEYFELLESRAYFT